MAGPRGQTRCIGGTRRACGFGPVRRSDSVATQQSGRWVSCSAVDEIAVEGQFADERVDLTQREGRRGPAVEIAPHEPIGGEPEFEGGVGGLFDDIGTMLLGEREDAEDAADAGGAVVAVDVVTDGGDGGAGALGGGEQGEGLGRGAGGPVRVRDAMPAPRRAQVLAEELAGSGVEQADVGAVPLHVDVAADPTGRRAVVGRRDLDAAVEGTARRPYW